MPAPQQPLEIDVTPPEAVVEFGLSQQERPRRWNVSGLGRDLAGDRRAVPLAAALAALAVLASLFSEWQITTVDPAAFGTEVGDRVIPSDVGDLGALGTGYLLGLFTLVATIVLTLFGPPPGRRYARLIGLSAGGTVLGLLMTLATSLGSHSMVIDRIYTLALDDGELSVAYGRGVWCAFAGVVLAMVALFLAGRHVSPGVVAPTTEFGAVATPAPEPDPVWSWRRPSATDDRALDEPLDLTVAPARPFTTLNDDRNRPS